LQDTLISRASIAKQAGQILSVSHGIFQQGADPVGKTTRQADDALFSSPLTVVDVVENVWKRRRVLISKRVPSVGNVIESAIPISAFHPPKQNSSYDGPCPAVILRVFRNRWRLIAQASTTFNCG
jgi:hypothetical protein